MANYNSKHKGKTIDDAIDKVITNNAGLQGVKIDNFELTPDSENKVNIDLSSKLEDYVTLDTAQNITGAKTLSGKKILTEDDNANNVIFNSDNNIEFTKILGKNENSEQHEILSLNEHTLDGTVYDQVEVGNKSVHLNLNTNYDFNYGVYVTVGTPLGEKTLAYTEDVPQIELKQTTGQSTTAVMSQKATTNQLENKVDKVSGKKLSTEDFSTEEKLKLSNIENKANKTMVSQTTGTSQTSVMSQKAVTDAISNIPIASKGTIPTTGIDISELDVAEKQWLRKIVFNETITLPTSSVGLKLKCKDLSDTYRIHFSSTSIEIYNNNGTTTATIYYSGSFKDSLNTEENITWDFNTKTLNFDNCVYQFRVDGISYGTISSLTNIGQIYLDSINGQAGKLSPIDIRQIENQNSLADVEGKSNLVGMTQKVVTNALNDLRNNASALQNNVVSNKLLNFTNWDLVLLSNNLASYQAARYSNGATIYGKMVLEYDSNTKNVIMRAIYKQSSFAGDQVKLFSFKDLKNNSTGPEFLFYTNTTNYYILDMKDGKTYRGNIGSSGVPSGTITEISTLPATISSYRSSYRLLSVNGLLYVIKTNSSGGTWTPYVSTNLGETWQSTGIEANQVYFLRYINGSYYMGIYLSSASTKYAILSSTDGINFTDLNATKPEIYDVVYDSSNEKWYGLNIYGWVSGDNIGEMTKVDGFQMYGNMLCRFSTSYPLGLMGFSNNNYLNNIYVTKDCITSEDSKQTFPKINGNSFYTYHPLEASSTNSNITAIMSINKNYYLGELQNYSGKLTPEIRIPPEFCLPSFSSTGTYSLKVVNGKIQWVSG